MSEGWYERRRLDLLITAPFVVPIMLFAVVNGLQERSWVPVIVSAVICVGIAALVVVVRWYVLRKVLKIPNLPMSAGRWPEGTVLNPGDEVAVPISSFGAPAVGTVIRSVLTRTRGHTETRQTGRVMTFDPLGIRHSDPTGASFAIRWEEIGSLRLDRVRSEVLQKTMLRLDVVPRDPAAFDAARPALHMLRGPYLTAGQPAVDDIGGDAWGFSLGTDDSVDSSVLGGVETGLKRYAPAGTWDGQIHEFVRPRPVAPRAAT